MEQCGDDEDFLRELLDDLRGEVSAQIEKIENTLKVRGGRGTALVCHPKSSEFAQRFTLRLVCVHFPLFYTPLPLPCLMFMHQGPDSADYYQHIQRASHVIKGAAANLMCHQLRQAAANLEKSAAKAYNEKGRSVLK